MGPLVTVPWLHEHLNDPDLIILDGSLPIVGVTPQVPTHPKYLEAHIPGAVFFDINIFSDQTTKLPHMLPDEETFSKMMSDLGLGDEMKVVVYEQGPVFSAPRVRWMLRTFGAKSVFLLDGGLKAWVAAGYPTSAGETTRKPSCFRAKLNPAAVKNYVQVEQLITGKKQILDARSAGRFTGKAPEPRPELSSGHMPGSINVPYSELIEDGRLKSVENLRELFLMEGVNLADQITTTCGSGVTAAVVALGLELVEAKDVSLYDGSWTDYAQQPAAKIVKDQTI